MSDKVDENVGDKSGKGNDNNSKDNKDFKKFPKPKEVLKFGNDKAQTSTTNGFKPYSELTYGFETVSCIPYPMGKRAQNQHSKVFCHLRYLMKHFVSLAGLAEGSSDRLTAKLSEQAVIDSCVKVLHAAWVKNTFKTLRRNRISSEWEHNSLSMEYVTKYTRFTDLSVVPVWFNLWMQGHYVHQVGFPAHIVTYLVPTNHIGQQAPVAQDVSMAAVYPSSQDYLTFSQVFQHLKNCGYQGVDSYKPPVAADDMSSCVAHMMCSEYESTITNRPIELYCYSEQLAASLTIRDCVIALISNKMAYLQDMDPDHSLDPVRTMQANFDPCQRGNRVPFECPFKFGTCQPFALFETFDLYIVRPDRK